MIIFTLWIILITASQQVRSDTVITINNNGNMSNECCVKGKCLCSSLFIALKSIESSTIVNITSKSVTLHNHTVIGSSSIRYNATITSNKAIVNCNKIGSVFFTEAVNVIIQGITWDQCGNPNSDGGISFHNIANLIIDDCTFQNSQTCALNLLDINYITIKNSRFTSNGLRKITSGDGECGGLKIDNTVVGNATIVISHSVFNGNGNFTDTLYNNSNNEGGISVQNITNLIIDNCTFQNFQTCALNLFDIYYITIKNSQFVSNGVRKSATSGDGECGGLKIDMTVVKHVTTVISDSVFSSNGGNFTDRLSNPIYGLFLTQTNIADINLTINKTNFVSNSGGIYLNIATPSTIILSELIVSDNINEGIKLSGVTITKGNLLLMILNSTVSNNGNGGITGFIFATDPNGGIKFVVQNSNFTDNKAVNFSNKALSIAISLAESSPLSIHIEQSNFVNNRNGNIDISASLSKAVHLVYFYKVVIRECVTLGSSIGSGAVSISLHSSLNNSYYFNYVNFTSNHYKGFTGGALFLKTANSENEITLINCVFQNNSGFGHGAAFYVADGVTSNAMVYATRISFGRVNFESNTAGDSIVYVAGGSINNTQIKAENTHFINNNGTALHLFISMLTFRTNVIFENNTANNGAALYLEQGTQVYFDDEYGKVTVYFVNNAATQYGGAIYVDLPSNCPFNGVMFHSPSIRNLSIYFMNNTAGIIGNSLYFNIREFCLVNSNVNSRNSLLYIPYKFNYSEGHNESISTSPKSVMLYFPNHDGSYMGDDRFFISNKILGKAITFTGAVFDYFNVSAQPTQFHVQCLIGCIGYALADDRLLVDNVSLLNITVSGRKIGLYPENITLNLTSILESFDQQISLQLIIELSPCFSGYFYNVQSNTCVCYNHQDIVECYNDYNEIKRGYWFGTVKNHSTPTVSLCPNHYCYFGKHRKDTRQGYCVIPLRLDKQCNKHRTGTACGECKEGYTLAYDSPDCINKDKCSAGMTILVVVLTILYWIVIVAVVFGLMHFQFQISSGYAYGIIYYYSIVDIVLDSNPYISDPVFQVVATLASFAKLTPKLFGQLCLVQGLSGIDQQFIHYFHPLAVSLVLLIIVLATRRSPRLTLYVSRCIIRVICLLLLLSYTSIASTSFQLLQSVHYPGYDGLYVYISPDMKYFKNRHAFYGVVALISGMIVVIGIPLFLLLEPLILNRWFNFIKVKPLLDQFQGCYKDEYRWFTAYYLICRLVIIVLVYFDNNDYYEMLYYLQTACVLIAMLHIWIQPYTDDFLNAFDGIVLLALVLVVNINAFTFLSSVTSVIAIILTLFPLIVLCLMSSKKFITYCTMSRHRQQYSLIDNVNHDNVIDDDRSNENDRSIVDPINDESDETDRDMTTFRESLLYQDYTN